MVKKIICFEGGATVSYNDDGRFGESPRRNIVEIGPFLLISVMDTSYSLPVSTGFGLYLQILDLRHSDGIARVEGFVIFVKGGQVGQNAKIKITQVGGRFATTDVIGEGAPQASNRINLVI